MRVTQACAQLFHLSIALEGRASDFFERRNRVEKFDSLDAAFACLRRRYGPDSAAPTALFKLNAAQQQLGEHPEDFADRIQDMALRAFPRSDPQDLENQMVFCFCRGLTDKSVGSFLLNSGLTSMSAVVDRYHRCIRSKEICEGKRDKSPHPVIRRSKKTTITDSSESEEDEASKQVRQIETSRWTPNKANTRLENKLDAQDKKLDKLISAIQALSTAVNENTKLMSRYLQENSQNRGRSSFRDQSPRTSSKSPRRSSQSPSRCHGCNEI